MTQKAGAASNAPSTTGSTGPVRDAEGRELQGTWELDTHFVKPMPPLSRQAWGQDFSEGLREACKLYGLMLDSLEFRNVDGFLYKQAHLVGAPKGGGSSKPPPRFLFRLFFALHPAIVARRRVARTVFNVRPWRADFQRWQQEIKPELVAAHRRLLSVKLPQLSDAALFEHIAACHQQLRRSCLIHGRYLMAALMPVADFLLNVSQWTGLEKATLMRLLRGFSPVSANRLPQTQALVDALRASPSAMQLLQQPEGPREVLERLMEHPEVGPAATEYLDIIGYRLTSGYDIGAPYAFEHPQLLLVGIRAALEAPAPVNALDEQVAEVRGKVPPQHQAQFDALLAETRLIYSLRDERILYGDSWSSGVLRRALLHAGERLVQRGALEAPEHFMEAELKEMEALLSGGKVPSAEVLAARARSRQRTAQEMPAFFGPPPPPPPPDDWFPEDMRRLMAITYLIWAEVDQSLNPVSPEVVRGVGVSSGSYTGAVRRVNGPEDLHLVRAGDVLVAGSTSPAYNLVLPLVGAIVTDWGGVLSHAAIVTREYGIPGVVGTRDGTRRLKDGDRVTVDGDTGEVRVVA